MELGEDFICSGSAAFSSVGSAGCDGFFAALGACVDFPEGPVSEAATYVAETMRALGSPDASRDRPETTALYDSFVWTASPNATNLGAWPDDTRQTTEKAPTTQGAGFQTRTPPGRCASRICK